MSCHSAISTKIVCLTLFVAAFLHRQVEAGVAAQVFTGASSSFVGQERPANSYQTDLWGMEFQERADKKKVLEQLPAGEDSVSAGASSIGVSANPAEWADIPGQAYLSDITEDTPFAEWQVERSAAGNPNQFVGGPTAWVMSGIHARTSRFGDDIPKTDGPSVLTLLVAVIACMVMVGALVSEK